MAIFQTFLKFGSTVYLLFLVMLKTLGTGHFASDTQIGVKFEQNVAVGYSLSTVKYKMLFFQKLDFHEFSKRMWT